MRRIVKNRSEAKNQRNLLAIAVLLFSVLPAFAQQASSAPAVEQKTDRQIIVSIPHRQLAVIEDGEVVKVYSVAVGADESPSPEGDFTVTRRLENPTYYHPGKVIPPGKSNPLGTRWIGLDKKGYGIHGTNVPTSIGKAASHGCIRMRQADLEELFARVTVGDKVTIRTELDDDVAQIFGRSSDALDNSAAQAAADAVNTSN